MTSSFTVDVRPAVLKEAQAIADLHVSATASAYRGLVPDEHLNLMPAPKRLGMWRDAIEYGDPQVQVALDGGKIVGFVGFDRSRDKGTKNTVGEIWSIYVAESHWDKGVGLALWDAAREALVEEGCTTVTVWIPLRNERALRFFDLAGFKRELNTAKTVPMGDIKIEEIRLKRALD
jgi:ribosomal protein S18 acetylase RimI-like enzyme